MGTAWAASDSAGLKRVNVAVGLGLDGNGNREIALIKEENKIHTKYLPDQKSLKGLVDPRNVFTDSAALRPMQIH